MPYGPSRAQRRRTKQLRHSPLKSGKKPPPTSKSGNKQKNGKDEAKDRKKGVRKFTAIWNENKKAIQKSISHNDFVRNFYVESEMTSTPKQIAEWKASNNVTIQRGMSEYLTNLTPTKSQKKQQKGRKVKELPKPILDFRHITWPDCEDITQNLVKKNFSAPTPIQSATWPLLLSGYNVVGIAKTGSGKTLAFLLPAIVHLRGQSRKSKSKSKHPTVLIVLPTRELAVQVQGEIYKFAKGLSHICVYGGSAMQTQATIIKGGVNIVVGTPGRIFHFVASRELSVGKVSFVVWDEADRLLDMGFAQELDCIMSCIRPDKQMVMYSATWPEAVRKCAAKHLCDEWEGDRNVVQVGIGSMDSLNANENVEQRIIIVTKEEQKWHHLCKFLEENRSPSLKVLVFMRLKRKCQKMATQLSQKGYYATSISGVMTQNARECALRDFKSGFKKIMFATDVAGRGIHVDNIKYVINYDLPCKNFEDYIHRIGRTGRAGRKGVAISYFNPEFDGHLARKLAKVLKASNQPVPQELYEADLTKKREWKKKKRFDKDVEFFRG